MSDVKQEIKKLSEAIAQIREGRLFSTVTEEDENIALHVLPVIRKMLKGDDTPLGKQIETIQRMRDMGLSTPTIAEALDIPQSIVHKINR